MTTPRKTTRSLLAALSLGLCATLTHAAPLSLERLGMPFALTPFDGDDRDDHDDDDDDDGVRVPPFSGVPGTANFGGWPNFNGNPNNAWAWIALWQALNGNLGAHGFGDDDGDDDDDDDDDDAVGVVAIDQPVLMPPPPAPAAPSLPSTPVGPQTQAVPEPGSAALLAAALVAGVAVRRRPRATR